MSDEEKIKRLQEELRLARQEVLHLSRLAELGKLVAVVAHEASQPLMGIKAFAQILRRRHDDDEFIGPKVRLIEQQARNMESILNNLKQFARRESGREQACQPGPVLQAVRQLLGEYARKKEATLIVEADNDLPAVPLSSGRLQQVLLNLVGNSLDALQATGGRVLIKAGREQEQLRLLVLDNGPGVAEELVDKLFEPFFTTKQEQGTGLGLSICRRIVEEAGGRLRWLPAAEIHPRPEGDFTTAFEVLLPAAGSQQVS